MSRRAGDVRRELIELLRTDQRTRERLVEDGSLFDGYAEEMERAHLRNADRLAAIIARQGWPGISRAGEEGAEAAWLVAQHAISRPDFQRRCLELLAEAVRNGEAAPLHEARLFDRIRFNERRPQRFGTIFDWDENGELSPWTIEQPDSVDERRAAVGLSPLDEAVRRVRADAEREGDSPPKEYRAREEEIRRWARSVGWI